MMIRTGTHKLVYYVERPYGELYDLEQDPDEMENLYNADEYQLLRQQLEGSLFEWLARSSYYNSGYKNQSAPMYEVKWLD